MPKIRPLLHSANGEYHHHCHERSDGQWTDINGQPKTVGYLNVDQVAPCHGRFRVNFGALLSMSQVAALALIADS
jgi:hypothetical protein